MSNEQQQTPGRPYGLKNIAATNEGRLLTIALAILTVSPGLMILGQEVNGRTMTPEDMIDILIAGSWPEVSPVITREDGLFAIAAEVAKARKKYTLEHDVNVNLEGDLANAAAFCLTLDPQYWPVDWSEEAMQWISAEPRIHRLAMAGAFCANEIEATAERIRFTN